MGRRGRGRGRERERCDEEWGKEVKNSGEGNGGNGCWVDGRLGAVGEQLEHESGTGGSNGPEGRGNRASGQWDGWNEEKRMKKKG
jgi:hypothetical protein